MIISTRRQAFTLIELLIVVAIIAILAAIAVPNFLEAQLRAKTSRARSDLRTVATALELYWADANEYPTMLDPSFNGGVAPLAGSRLKWWYLPNSLSTPVAYLPNANLLCPFGGSPDRADVFPDNIWRRYSYENVADLAANVGGFSILEGKYGPAAEPLTRIGRWRVLSVGPLQNWNPMEQYDPTNGSKSEGNVIRCQADPEGIGSEQRP